MSASSSELVDKCWTRDWNGLCDSLIQGHPVNEEDCNGLTSLQVCAALGWTSALSMLLKYGADVHMKNPMGWTALMQAVRNGHIDATEILLDAGANVDDRNSLGWDVISLAVASNNDVLLTKLVQKTKASHLSSALLIACQIGSVDAVQFLIHEKVDVNYKAPVTEITPLMLAASGGHESIIKILLQKHANPFATNSYNLTASDMALMNSRDTSMAILSLHVKPKVALKHNLSFDPLYLSIPQKSDKTISLSHHIQVDPCKNFYLPMHFSPVVQPTSPQVFLYPPPSGSVASPSLNHNSFLGVSPSNCFPYSPVYLIPPACHCTSPCMASPMIPAWMFSPWQKAPKKDLKPTGKTRKSIRKWWSGLKKRCNVKRQKKRSRVYMTYGEEIKVSYEPRDTKLEEVLSVLNLEYLAPLLRSHEIDGETFKHLRENDLEELGIVDKELQLSILQKIANLCANLTSGAL